MLPLYLIYLFPVAVNSDFPSCPIPPYFTGFVTRLIRRAPLVEQELLTHPEHLSSLPVLSGARVTRSLDLCVCVVDHCLSFCPFYFDHCVLRFTDSDYPFNSAIHCFPHY